MIPVETAINRFRRDLTVSSLLKLLLAAAALVALVLGPLLGMRGDGLMLLVLIGAVWLVLSYRSVRGSRMAADSTMLIAAGQFEQAEQQIEAALQSFSLFRTVKLLSLHHLAVLRHTQRRWGESAALCRAILGQRLGMMQSLSKPSRLMLADALLEMGDVRGAHEALAGLYRHRLTLGEAMKLLVVQLDYLARLGAWDQMLWSLRSRVQMAELMPAADSARTQAILALAAKKAGRNEVSQWLRRRVELLREAEKMITERPVLAELWP